MKSSCLTLVLPVLLINAPFAILSGCSDPAAASATVQSCPCATGAVCCSSGVCAKDEAQCTTATAALTLLNRGTWTGYVENFAFDSGTDDLRLSIDMDPAGNVTGQIVLGGVPTPPPPTDPSVGWPLGYLYGTHAGLEYAEGYPYPASAVRWESLRLRMQVATNDAWQQWCALQSSYQLPMEDKYVCVPPGNGTATLAGPCSIDGDPPMSVDCGRLGLCWLEGCHCTQGGCAAAELGANVFLDVALDGDHGDGSIRLGSPDWVNSKIYNVRLVRTGS